VYDLALSYAGMLGTFWLCDWVILVEREEGEIIEERRHVGLFRGSES
jgi:hypothetical protein